ncbi:hypothetical protein TGCAST_387850 [Toxoplasma gondii CAST]|uniref:Uncharacterized protein n=1 Tax=Toxoplasma gondii CAST TaxID=943122 RepID=A0A425I2E4_TOXGO|nr:hypothetical protein TGCAST_387850 [Toxoplasma gondii CAST]
MTSEEATGGRKRRRKRRKKLRKYPRVPRTPRICCCSKPERNGSERGSPWRFTRTSISAVSRQTFSESSFLPSFNFHTVWAGGAYTTACVSHSRVDVLQASSRYAYREDAGCCAHRKGAPSIFLRFVEGTQSPSFLMYTCLQLSRHKTMQILPTPIPKRKQNTSRPKRSGGTLIVLFFPLS